MSVSQHWPRAAIMPRFGVVSSDCFIYKSTIRVLVLAHNKDDVSSVYLNSQNPCPIHENATDPTPFAPAQTITTDTELESEDRNTEKGRLDSLGRQEQITHVQIEQCASNAVYKKCLEELETPDRPKRPESERKQ